MAPLVALDSADAVDGRHIRAVAFQDVRLDYLTGTLRRLGIDPAGRSALVVGGGRGLLARGLARLGLDVVSLDPSARATALARRAARDEDGSPAAVEYRTAGDPGPPDRSFDIVFVTDTFEVAADLDRAVAHAARLLRPDGVLFYDTVNRTPVSRLIYLGAFQALPLTRIMPRGRYSAARLRTPDELTAALAAHGLRNAEICPFKPGNALDLVRAVVARRRGRIGDDRIPAMTNFVLDPGGDPVVTYLGHARPTADRVERHGAGAGSP